MSKSPKHSPSLPKLCCAIYRDGKLYQIAEMPDPRQFFCEEFNKRPFKMPGGKHYTARPINSRRDIAAARRAHFKTTPLGQIAAEARAKAKARKAR